MTTREWIEKIPEVNRKTITMYSDLIAEDTIRASERLAAEDSKKLRGYLECMKDCGIITQSGLQALYLYFRSVRVENIKEARG